MLKTFCCNESNECILSLFYVCKESHYLEQTTKHLHDPEQMTMKAEDVIYEKHLKIYILKYYITIRLPLYT